MTDPQKMLELTLREARRFVERDPTALMAAPLLARINEALRSASERLAAPEDTYHAAWLELLDFCNKLKEENFNLRQQCSERLAAALAAERVPMCKWCPSRLACQEYGCRNITPTAPAQDGIREALEPFAIAAREFTSAIGPDGIDDGITVVATMYGGGNREAFLSTADFSRAATALAALPPQETKPGEPGEPAPSTGRCICQDQHRRGYCTEPGCPFAAPSTTRREGGK